MNNELIVSLFHVSSTLFNVRCMHCTFHNSSNVSNVMRTISPSFPSSSLPSLPFFPSLPSLPSLPFPPPIPLTLYKYPNTISSLILHYITVLINRGIAECVCGKHIQIAYNNIFNFEQSLRNIIGVSIDVFTDTVGTYSCQDLCSIAVYYTTLYCKPPILTVT